MRYIITFISLTIIVITFSPYHPLIEAKSVFSLRSDEPVILNFQIYSDSGVISQRNVQNSSSQTELGIQFTQRQAYLEDIYNKVSSEVKQKREYQAQLASRVAKLTTYLARQGSPIATTKYAELIITLTDQAKTDYRIIVAIMGVESGFCAANYMVYNCFGYLNGVQYPNYETAFRRLIPRIAKEYANVYRTDFLSLAKAYGVDNYEAGANKLNTYYSQLK